MTDPKVRVILCPAGNAVGKSWLAAMLALWAYKCFDDTKVITTGPTFEQLRSILWSNIMSAYDRSELSGQDRVRKSELLISDRDDHFLTGINPDNIEAASGYHGNVIAIVDESSGLTAAKDEAIASWNCRKRLYIGNLNHAAGPFYEKIQKQKLDPDDAVRLIRIPALESPAIRAGVRRSPDGLADLDWLDDMRREYGEGSNRWLVGVLAEAPNAAEDQLLPRDWVDRGFAASHAEDKSALCLAVDLATGNGGDRSVLLVRSGERIVNVEASNRWGLEETAAQAAKTAAKFKIRHDRIVYDQVGIGEGFDYFLEAKGIKGARGFKAGVAATGSERKFANLKSAAAWALRHRLDPARNTIPFSLGAVNEGSLRPELQAWTYGTTPKGQVILCEKKAVVAILGKSPDISDALIMSFAIPDRAA